MRIVWTPQAQQDRADIWDFIATDNPNAAAWLDQLFSTAAESLSDFPMRGRSGQISGTRELIPHESYRLVYEVDGEMVWVLAIVHTARQWPLIRD